MTLALSPEQLLRWYILAGVDETIGDQPLDRYALAKAPPRPEVSRAAAAPPPVSVQATAAHLAMGCATLTALRAAMESFDGGSLKRTSQTTVFADGNPEAKVMLVGEAPGPEEDRQGRPFVGAAGQLLDRMLASIGLDRTSAYLTTVLPWRVPGNRKPEPAELGLCLPFIERHIELVDPAILIFLGGTPASALLARQEAISRLRGRWMDYSSPGLGCPVPAIATFHPDNLLATPAFKREAWGDFLAVFKRLQVSR